MIRADKFLPPADRLALLLDAEGIRYQREFAFATGIGRRWRADFYISVADNTHLHLTAPSALQLLIEVEGGTWATSRHTTGSGFSQDVTKYAEAQCLGFMVLRVTPRNIDVGDAIRWVKKLIGRES